MSAYIIAYRETPVQDEIAMTEYSRLNRSNAAAFKESFGIEPLAAHGAVEVLEGEKPEAVVLLKFPSMTEARAWYHSAVYQEAAEFRRRAAEWRFVLVDGLD